MVGLNERDMQAVIYQYNLQEYYYPTLFPLQESVTLSWKMLEGQAGLRIAADLVSRGSSIPRKTRESISRISGEIPKIAIAREKLEDELTEYDIMLAFASQNADLRALVEFWAEDTQYCWTGVAARLEWIALQQISLGKVKFSNANNASVVTEYDVDYQLDASTQKFGVVNSWAAGTDGKPFTKDFPQIVRSFRDRGIYLKYAFMNLDTFVQLSSQDETIKMCGSVLGNLANATFSPSIDQVNATMSSRPNLYGLQVVVINPEKNIAIELADGSRSNGNPFADNVVSFSESKVMGKTYWKRPIDLNVQDDSIKVMNGAAQSVLKGLSDSDLRNLADRFASVAGSPPERELGTIVQGIKECLQYFGFETMQEFRERPRAQSATQPIPE